MSKLTLEQQLEHNIKLQKHVMKFIDTLEQYHKTDDGIDVGEVLMEAHSAILGILITYVDVTMKGDKEALEGMFEDLVINTLKVQKSFSNFVEDQPERHTKGLYQNEVKH